jgi:hypothetical protein
MTLACFRNLAALLLDDVLQIVQKDSAGLPPIVYHFPDGHDTGSTLPVETKRRTLKPKRVQFVPKRDDIHSFRPTV